MIQIFTHANYDFVGKRRWYYALSILGVLISLGSLIAHRGLAYGIDFSGGFLLQVRYERPVSVETVRRGLDRVGAADAVIQQFGGADEYLIRVPRQVEGPQIEALNRRVRAALSETSRVAVEIRRAEFVGAQVGQDLQMQAVYAIGAAVLGILIYLAIRFDFRGGVVATAAIAHDVIVSLGALSLTGRELSLPVLAALLTIVGYSINDTIVVFDRIRERRAAALARSRTLAALVNEAINQTLSRTVLTSFTTFLAAFVLFVFGGEVLNDFAFALVVGIVTGTYSSVAASAVLLDWETWRARRRRTAAAVRSVSDRGNA